MIRRHGSIRKAADLLSVSPSALNRSIQGFEESLGVRIFDRVPAGVRLTSAGELLVDVVERHLVEFEDLQRQLGFLRDGHMGQLRIGIGADIAAGLPLFAIRDLEEEMPGVSADIVTGDIVNLLLRRELDLAILTNPETDRAVEVLASQSVPLVALATPGWASSVGVGVDGAANGGARVGLWDMVRTRIVVPPEGTGSRAVISHALRRHALEEGATTSVAASQLPLAMATGARSCIFPATVFAGADGIDTAAGLVPLAVDVGTVQVSVLRHGGIPLTRPGQILLRQVERRLNALA
jgi:DNA-binding transcriptional LysR family regulator